MFSLTIGAPLLTHGCPCRSRPFLGISPKFIRLPGAFNARRLSHHSKTFPIEKITIEKCFYILSKNNNIHFLHTNTSIPHIYFTGAPQTSRSVSPVHGTRGYRSSTTSSAPIRTVATLRSFITSLAVRVWPLNVPRKACVASRSGPLVPFEPQTRGAHAMTMAPRGCHGNAGCGMESDTCGQQH